MTGTGDALTVLLVGLLIPLALAGKALARRLAVPPLAVWIVLGLVTRLTAEPAGLVSEYTEEVLRFLGEIGVAILLFRIGLESKLSRLMGTMGQALIVWAGNVGLSGLAGYGAARYLLGLSVPLSIVLGVALTATSVGVTVGTWRAAGKLETRQGHLLLDVAELDDISSMVFMGLLFSILPALTGSGGDSLPRTLLTTSAWFVLRMVAFILFCVLFARYIEGRITTRLTSLEHGPDPMLTVAAMGLIIAAIAGISGFSMALGAFFAGIAFSRDPEAVGMDASFDPLYELFTPFFFIHLGMSLTLTSSDAFIGATMILLAAAIVGKVLGAMIPGAAVLGWRDALNTGVSLVPRAEITMIVMRLARGYAPEMVTTDVFAAMTAVSIVTCLLAPPLTRFLLKEPRASSRRARRQRPAQRQSP
jgi:Kef-type K+ transport system membrane component KefB